MIPKIVFRYSSIYDDQKRNSDRIQQKLKEKGEKYPSVKKIRNYIEDIKGIWGGLEKNILKELADILGLKWKEDRILCYVIGYGKCFSDPLTVKIYKNKNDFIDTLTHELIHQLQIQNHKKMTKWWEYLNKKYENDTKLTKSHILLHSVHNEVYLKLFDKNRLKRNIRIDKEYEDYKRSWEIVLKEGYKNIINEFRRRLQ